MNEKTFFFLVCFKFSLKKYPKIRFTEKKHSGSTSNLDSNLNIESQAALISVCTLEGHAFDWSTKRSKL